MRRVILCTAMLLLLAGLTAQAATIRGDYVESRNADVWVAACYANSEVGLVGDNAILAWRVKEGRWDGVQLDGLSVVAVVKASGTLGDPYSQSLPARAVFIVDEQASPAQRQALVKFAQAEAGELLADVERVVAAPIQLRTTADPHAARAWLQAGDLAAIKTRRIGENDHLCGNEATYYSPLVELEHAMPAVAETDRYSGPGLDETWTNHGKRSAFVGTFAR